MGPAGALRSGTRDAAGMPQREIRLENVRFAYPTSSRLVLDGLDLTIPAGKSLAIVGQNGAGKTTLAKLLCRMYDPTEGTISVDGVDLRELDIASWRARIAAVFQDYRALRADPARQRRPAGAPSDDDVLAALDQARAANLADLDTVLSRALRGRPRSLGRAVAAGRARAGAVRGTARCRRRPPRRAHRPARRAGRARDLRPPDRRDTRRCTTILISHRFSTVRRADLICVVEGGRVIELGTHDELVARGGRYKEMFELQASRFDDPETKKRWTRSS